MESMVRTITLVGICDGESNPSVEFLSGGAEIISQPSTVVVCGCRFGFSLNPTRKGCHQKKTDPLGVVPVFGVGIPLVDGFTMTPKGTPKRHPCKSTHPSLDVGPSFCFPPSIVFNLFFLHILALGL